MHSSDDKPETASTSDECPPPFGRVLFLSADAATLRAQLDGANVDLSRALPLRDDISTDEITPMAALAHYDDALGRHPYTGLRVGGETPITLDAVATAGFTVTVAGKRYGKGSSREHSPMAEKLAGIRLVIAESFERLYRQNADNIGLLTSTDFSLIERIQGGERIALRELLAGRDALASDILACGGLLGFGRRYLGNITAPPLPQTTRHAGPRTLFEKIIARHLLSTATTRNNTNPGQGVFVRADWRFIHEYYTGMCAHMLRTAAGPAPALHDAASIVAFEDHTSYVEASAMHRTRGLVQPIQAMCRAHREFVAAHGLRSHRTLAEDEAAQDKGDNVAGISHAMMTEHYALPGQLVVGTDSHTPHSGALGCVAFGVGSTDMANAFITGAVRMTLPESLLIRLEGHPPAGITAKDIVLDLLARTEIRAGLGVGKVFEFAGPVVDGLSVDERATLTNMTAELGGLTGIVAPDSRTVRFLRERRGVEFVVESWMRSDTGAHYAATLRVDCTRLTPMVARPGDPGNGIALKDLPAPVRVDIAYGGSCTAGKRADFDHYHEVLAWGLARGLRVPDSVTLYLQYGTTAVRDYCIERGYDRVFQAVGARILEPSCGACANCGPGSSTRADQVTVSAINRNFPGRSGPGEVWLASPPTVVASALAGELTSFEELKKRQ